MDTQVPGYIYDLCRKLRQKPTRAEKLLWECLRNKRLNGLIFRRQHPIGRYIADFYCRQAGLVVELDGKIHQLKQQRHYDEIRKEVIEMRGIRVLRIKNEEIKENIGGVIKKIVALTSPPVPLSIKWRGGDRG